jgi:hypothetical protein
LNHVNQQIENLRLDGDLLGTSPKLAPLDIQGIVLKAKLHLDELLRRRCTAAILRNNQANLKGKFSGP